MIPPLYQNFLPGFFPYQVLASAYDIPENDSALLWFFWTKPSGLSALGIARCRDILAHMSWCRIDQMKKAYQGYARSL